MDLDEAPIIHGLELPSRCLCAQSAETNVTRFLVATQSLRQENQLHIIEFDDENNVIDKTVFTHSMGEVWHLAASYNNKDIFSSCYHSFESGKIKSGCMLMKLPSGDSQEQTHKSANIQNPISDSTRNQHSKLEGLAVLNTEGYGDISSTHWRPIEGENILMALADNNMIIYDVEGSRAEMISHFCGPNYKGQPTPFTAGRWNPHHGGKQFAVTLEQNILGWDIRSEEQAFIIENAHSQLVRDIDFNPNKMYYLVSCGDDCQVKFWDIRYLSDPVAVQMDDHSHWVWSTRYNPFHDQLVLSGGSDSKVILYSMTSISSEPYNHSVSSNDEDESDSLSIGSEEDQTNNQTEDGVISVYEEHEDSVYVVEWSAADPWTFASLSYDGRCVINRVPKKVKYGILL